MRVKLLALRNDATVKTMRLLAHGFAYDGLVHAVGYDLSDNHLAAAGPLIAQNTRLALPCRWLGHVTSSLSCGWPLPARAQWFRRRRQPCVDREFSSARAF